MGGKRQQMEGEGKKSVVIVQCCICVCVCLTVRDRVCHVCEGTAWKRRAIRPSFFEETHSHCHIDQTTASYTLMQPTPCSSCTLIGGNTTWK